MSKRPRLLFLAYFFPPANTAGCVRTWNIAKYLSRAGWDVTVVTPNPSVWRRAEFVDQVAVELEREGIQRILTGHRLRHLLPDYLQVPNSGLPWFVGGVCRQTARYFEIDPAVGWVQDATRACEALSRNDVDVILASGSPFISFSLAKKLSDRLSCPYVLDYRDLWTGNPYRLHSPRMATVRLESELLSGCAAVTTVSDSLRADLGSRFTLASKLHVVTNGFCPEELSKIRPAVFDHFAVVYTGQFYPPKSVISPVAAALREVKRTGMASQPWRLHYYGAHEAHVRNTARHFGLEREVMLHGKVSRTKALAAVRGASIAVVITSVNKESTSADRGVVTAKLFEALGLGTSTLVIAPQGSDIEAITAQTGLARCFPGNDIGGISFFLAQAMLGDLPDPKNPGAYSWPVIVQDLDALLREVVGLKASTVSYKRREPTRVKA